MLAVLGFATLALGSGSKPASAAPAVYAPQDPVDLINFATGLCLVGNSAGHVSTQACSIGGDDEMWVIRVTPSSSPNVALQNVGTGLWLDSNSAGALYTNAGNGGAYQSWVELYPNDNGEFAFQDVATGRWLDSNSAGSAYTNPGNGGPYQSWKL